MGTKKISEVLTFALVGLIATAGAPLFTHLMLGVSALKRGMRGRGVNAPIMIEIENYRNGSALGSLGASKRAYHASFSIRLFCLSGDVDATRVTRTRTTAGKFNLIFVIACQKHIFKAFYGRVSYQLSLSFWNMRNRSI